MKRRKHVPLRTCIACQQKRPKRELLRIVRRPEGVVEVDPRGKLSGRGAYLCVSQECLETALEQRRLARALKCEVRDVDVSALRKDVAGLLAEHRAEWEKPPTVGEMGG